MAKYMSAERFIEIWQTSKSKEEVMEETGLGYHAVQARYNRYINNGVPLKKLPRREGNQTGGNYNDWRALAALARSYEEEENE